MCDVKKLNVTLIVAWEYSSLLEDNHECLNLISRQDISVLTYMYDKPLN